MIEIAPDAEVVMAQPGPQQLLLSCPATRIFSGGARGGGKSFGVLLFALNRARRYGKRYKAILLRETFPQMDELHAQSAELFPQFGATWKEAKRTWMMPGGGTLKMRYLASEKDAMEYQGHQYTDVIYDEVGNMPTSKPIDALNACLRNAHGIPSKMLLTGNWGGPGHNWLRSRYYDPAPPLTLIPEKSKVTGRTEHRVFIPSKLSDNPALEVNDPGYVDRVMEATEGKPWLREAWVFGNPDIVAGGLLDDAWDEPVHVLKPFAIPKEWYLDRSYDHGSSKPFSVIWWAEANGEDAVMADGTVRSFPAGTLFAVAEWYGVKTVPSKTGDGFDTVPNEGLRMLSRDIADGIKHREQMMGIFGRCKPGPADRSIWDVAEGTSIGDDMEARGVMWLPAAKGPGSRVAGAEALRARLLASRRRPMEEPGLFLFSTCRHGIRTLPVIPRDDRNHDDADTNSEDHWYDAARYRVRAKPVPKAGEVRVLGI